MPRRLGHTRAGQEQRPVAADEVPQQRPAGRQGLVGQRDDGVPLRVAIGDEQARGDERVHEPARARPDRQCGQRRAAARRSTVGRLADLHERAQHAGRHVGDLDGQRVVELARAAGDRAFDPAQRVVRGPRQPGAVPLFVQLLQRELEQRQGGRALRRGLLEGVRQALAGSTAHVVDEAGRLYGLADHLAELGGRGRHHVHLARPLLQRDEDGHVHERGVEVAPHRGQDPHAARARQRAKRLREGLALGAARALAGEDLLELVGDQRQPDGPLRGPLEARELVLDVGGGRRRPPAQDLGHGVDAVAAERRLVRERQGERLEGVRPVTGLHQGVAKLAAGQVGIDHARIGEQGHDPGPHEGRLARPAASEHQHEADAAPDLGCESLPDLVDGSRASEEDALVLGLEGQQTAKRRALPRRARRSAPAQPVLDVEAEVLLEALGEGTGAVVRVVGAGVRAVLGVPEVLLEEALDELDLPHLCVEPRLLPLAERASERLLWVRGPPVHDHVRPTRLGSAQRVLELPLRAGGPRAVGAGIGTGQLATEARPQDHERQVALRGERDAVLEGGVGGQRLPLPPHRVELDAAPVPALDPLDRSERQLAFLPHVAGRREEDADPRDPVVAHGPPRQRAAPMLPDRDRGRYRRIGGNAGRASPIAMATQGALEPRLR